MFPSLFDKPQIVKTLNNDNGDPFTFKQQENLLYKGKVSVNNGEFRFSFVVPREIAYNFGNGRLSYYSSGEGIDNDASGYFEKFIIGGISSGVVSDNTGPVIKLYLNDSTFRNGGIANSTAFLFAQLSDENGINIAGTGIGHSIIATLDNNSSNAYNLNNYFESAIDDYKSGTISYKLPAISAGKHTLSLKAWDIFNNSSISEINFEVVDSSNLIIKNIFNYPNPFSGFTNFVFEHNQPGKNLDVELQIFSLTGQLVNSDRMNVLSDGFSSGPIPWDGNTNNYKKLDKGIYVYRFVFRYNGTQIVSESKKMVVVE
ncbi:MAG: T9SS type A sorting domain-containing protein [Bacteroidetes bacterium]|nr:T9SS type A sorting domain-containing protein [Bacteroidota bacterium]